MSDLVARTGRHQQRYEAGCRLIAGCIPFRYKISDNVVSSKPEKTIEVLMINSQSGPGLLFPKDFLGYYYFRSKSLQDDFSPEGLCKAAMFPLLVTEELCSWPEQSTRQRSWVTIPEAAEQCRHPWMEEALVEGFSKWHANQMINVDDED
ncbi:hypothetical protein KFK09_015306 [Dendrobium nobile]|uniref:Uncharacterized protein n=1 Tax=Dendrobium nobile TaxID=94219 RepID=A0A8T3B4E9_DENNO|nr:hypothetical protein KFK09_015306 [Dendrobium nobile]